MPKTVRAFYVFETVIIYGCYLLICKKEKSQEWLFTRFSTLGGVYIKFLQLTAMSDTVAGNTEVAFKDILAIYDQVSYEEININNLIRTELGKKADLITLDNDKPFAAGSFAQVYGGVLNGQRIIIKALRPSVAKYLRFDLSLLGVATKMISAIQPQKMLDFAKVFHDFKRITIEEIDYKHEVINAVQLAKQLSDHPVIHIPQTFTELSTSNIIIQERVDGLALTQLFTDKIKDKVEYIKYSLNTDLNYVMEQLAIELLKGSLTDSGTHGDPHPGNIYLLRDNKIALIDFGIGVTVEKHQQELLEMISQYAAAYRGEFNPERFLKVMISYFVPDLTRSIQTLSAYFEKQDLVDQTLHEIGLSAVKTISEQSGSSAITMMIDQYKLLNIFTQIVNKGNRFGLSVTMEAPAFFRSTQIFMQIIRRLDCDKQLLRRAWENVLALDSSAKLTQSIASYDNESIDNSLHMVAGWFERLRYSDPSLYNRIEQVWGDTI